MEFIFDGFRRQTGNPEEDEMLDTKISPFLSMFSVLRSLKNRD